MKPPLKTLRILEERQLLQEGASCSLAPVEERFSISVTEEMAAAMTGQSDDPLARQFLPSVDELVTAPEELGDPIGDRAHTPVEGIVHRHGDRCLLLPLHSCPVYCRFCFRREKVGSGAPGLSNEALDRALDYIEQTTSLREVILSGGDPLFLSERRLSKILSRLHALPHLEHLRIHTRVPLVQPGRITSSLLSLLRSVQPLYVVLHANHAQEFTPDGIAALASLADGGVPLLSQTVLLRGVNNSEEALKTLMRTFARHRVKPYYLHHLDLARGTSHFRCSIQEGQRLVTALRRDLSGLCQPTYVLDLPGGYGKIPLTPGHLKETEEGYRIADFEGRLHDYPLAEKEQ